MIPKYSLKQILHNSPTSLPYPPSKNLTKEFEFLYKPNDDSYMLLHTIITDLEQNFKINPNLLSDVLNICELGIGSGFVINNLITFLKKLNLENKNNLVNKEEFIFYGIDININSCLFVKDFAKFHKNKIEIINTRNFQGLDLLKKKIDILILNPPYVVTPKKEISDAQKKLEKKNFLFQKEKNFEEVKFEKESNAIALAYAGGIDGNDITRKMLKSAENYLSDKGFFYLLLIEDNKPYQLLKEFKFKYELLSKEKFTNEIIYIFKLFF